MGIASEFPGKNVRTVGRREPGRARTGEPEFTHEAAQRLRARCDQLEAERLTLLHRARRGDPRAAARLLQQYHFRFVAV